MSEENKKVEETSGEKAAAFPSIEAQYAEVLRQQGEVLTGLSALLVQAMGRIENLEEAIFGGRNSS